MLFDLALLETPFAQRQHGLAGAALGACQAQDFRLAVAVKLAAEAAQASTANRASCA